MSENEDNDAMYPSIEAEIDETQPHQKSNTLYEGIVYYMEYNNTATVGTYIIELEKRLSREKNKPMKISWSFVEFMDELIIAGIKGRLMYSGIQFRVLFKIQFKLNEKDMIDGLLKSRRDFFLEQMNEHKNDVMNVNLRRIKTHEEIYNGHKMKEMMRYRNDTEYRDRKREHARNAYYRKKLKTENSDKCGCGDGTLSDDVMNIKNIQYTTTRRRGRPTKEEMKKIEEERKNKYEGNPYNGLMGFIKNGNLVINGM